MERQQVTKTNQGDSQRATPLFAKPALSSHAPAHPIMQLQRHLGNEAFGRFIQAKLTVNQPGDMYEQEADRVAEQVMRMPDSVSPQSVSGISSGIQRKCAACAGGGGTCPHCAEEEEMMQRKPLAATITPLIQRQEMQAPEEEEEEILQAKESPGTTPAVSPAVESHISAMRGGGQPLSPSVRAFFEPRFEYDFSQVRVHADTQAAESARAVHARAYTVGQDVVFGAGQYAPETNYGQKLIGHELTHVVQQRQNITPMSNDAQAAVIQRCYEPTTIPARNARATLRLESLQTLFTLYARELVAGPTIEEVIIFKLDWILQQENARNLLEYFLDCIDRTSPTSPHSPIPHSPIPPPEIRNPYWLTPTDILIPIIRFESRKQWLYEQVNSRLSQAATRPSEEQARARTEHGRRSISRQPPGAQQEDVEQELRESTPRANQIQELCYAPGALPTITPGESSLFGSIVEIIIEKDYCDRMGCSRYTGVGSLGTDYFDNRFFPVVYAAFIIDHNPHLTESDRREILRAAYLPNQQKRPDISTHKPGRRDFYEIKPNSDSGLDEGRDKIRRLLEFHAAFSLPYDPGTMYVPTDEIPIASGHVGPWPIEVFLRVNRIQDGLVVYEICARGELLNIGLATVLLILAAIVVIILSRRRIPVPLPDPLPVPDPGLPPPQPVPPIPVPVPPIPVPVPGL